MTTLQWRLIALSAAIAASMAIFGIWPGLDLWVTGLFHDPVHGFAAMASGWPNRTRLAIWRLSEAMLILSVGALAYGAFRRSEAFGLPRRVWLYVVGLYVAAPGLMVDLFLKPVWGRARPANVQQFGGLLDFTPAFQITNECSRNCSFVSGEVAGGVALAVSLMLIMVHLRHRMSRLAWRVAVAIILSLPILIAFQRIGAGRHFLSDAIFATLFTLLVAVVLAGMRNLADRIRTWLRLRPAFPAAGGRGLAAGRD